MIYVKSVLAGLVAAVVAMALPIALVAAGAYAWMQFETWRQAGSGGIGAVSVGIAEGIVYLGLTAGVVAFVVGFRWEFRRASRASRPTP
jgi:hypothetical protein